MRLNLSKPVFSHGSAICRLFKSRQSSWIMSFIISSYTCKNKNTEHILYQEVLLSKMWPFHHDNKNLKLHMFFYCKSSWTNYWSNKLLIVNIYTSINFFLELSNQTMVALVIRRASMIYKAVQNGSHNYSMPWNMQVLNYYIKGKPILCQKCNDLV